MEKRIHIFIYGRVQGVGFRWHTIRMATSLSLTGWVMNLRDGRIEAVFEGNNDNIITMVEWCKMGPTYASVEKVNTTEEAFIGEFKDFGIRFQKSVSA